MLAEITVIAHNIRSTHNVGSLIRNCEGLGVKHLYLTGYTPYPKIKNDERLPHIYQKLSRQIHKTALGAESYLAWSYRTKAEDVVEELRNKGYKICALEQADNAKPLSSLRNTPRVAIILGSEVNGIEKNLIDQTDLVVEIPMRGKKESFNVTSAAAMAIYHLSNLQ